MLHIILSNNNKGPIIKTLRKNVQLMQPIICSQLLLHIKTLLVAIMMLINITMEWSLLLFWPRIMKIKFYPICWCISHCINLELPVYPVWLTSRGGWSLYDKMLPLYINPKTRHLHNLLLYILSVILQWTHTDIVPQQEIVYVPY